MYLLGNGVSFAKVALPTEGVDRNLQWFFGRFRRCVALPTEGVDRNWLRLLPPLNASRRPPHGGRG